MQRHPGDWSSDPLFIDKCASCLSNYNIKVNLVKWWWNLNEAENCVDGLRMNSAKRYSQAGWMTGCQLLIPSMNSSKWRIGVIAGFWRLLSVNRADLRPEQCWVLLWVPPTYISVGIRCRLTRDLVYCQHWPRVIRIDRSPAFYPELWLIEPITANMLLRTPAENR